MGIVSALQARRPQGPSESRSPHVGAFPFLGKVMIDSPNSIHIYLDESGDLGWTFTAPYGAGGSSRFLTIASVCVPPAESHLPKRLVKNMYVKYNWPSGIERKFVQLLPSQRLEFAQDAKALCDAHPDICIHAIVVK